MSDLIITPGSGKIDFIYQSGQEVSRLESIIIDPIDGLVFSGKISASSVTSPINVTATSSNVNYPFIFASSGETGAKNLLIDSAGGTYNPSTNTATIDVSGNLTGTATTASYANALNPANSYTVVGITGALTGTSSWASNATNALQLGGTVASSYVTLTGTQTLTGKTITGTFTGSLFGTSSWATNATTATTVTTNANLTGEVTSIGNATTISSSAITTAKIADAAVTNAKLASSSVTIGSTAVSLGAAATVTIAGLNSVTSTTFVGSLTGTATTASYANALNAANQYTVGGITGSLFGTSSWATNATNALTATNATQLNGQAASYYTNIPARLGYTPVNQAGDTVTGNLIINGNFSVNGSFTAFSASNVYISSSQLYIEDNILTLNAFSPYLRYAGIEMYDSGSGTLSNLLWDGEGDYFFLSGSSVNGKIITGPDSQANLTANFVPKATAGYKLGNSLIYDNGTNVGIGTTTPNSTLQIAGTSTGILTVGTLTNDWGGVVAIGTTNGNGIILSKVNTANDSNRVLVLMRDDTNGASIIGYAPAGTYDSVGFQIRASASSYFNGGNVGIGTTVPVAKLHVNSTTAGATLLRTDGTNGTLFSVVDDLSDSLMSVNNSAGLPVLEVFADDRIVAGQYGQNDLVVINNKVGIGTNNPANKLTVSGSTSIGESYINTTSPSNGLIVQGNVGIGTTAPGAKLEISSSTAASLLNVKGAGGNGLLFVSGSGIVGIGTASPANSKLHIYADHINGHSVLKIQTITSIATSGTPSLGFFDSDGTRNTLLYAASDGTNLANEVSKPIIFSTNSTERMRIDSGGAVGIGTSTVSRILHAYVTTGPVMRVQSSGSNASIEFIPSIGHNRYNWLIGAQQNISDAFEITPSTATNGTTFTTPAILVAPSGNIGIGTTSPTQRLDLSGSLRIRSAGTYSDPADNAGFINYDSTGGIFTFSARSNSGNTYMAFRTSNAGTAGERMRIINDGNVGIGTTSPQFLLDVVNTSTTSRLRIGNAGSNNGAQLILAGSNTTKNWVIANQQNLNGTLEFTQTTATGSSTVDTTPSMVINSSGNVGIGTTTVGNKLTVVTSTQYDGYYLRNSNGVVGTMLGVGTTNDDGTIGLYSSVVLKTNITANGASYFNGGSVGIGTTSPTAKLEVYGTSGDSLPTFKITSTNAPNTFNYAGTILNSSLGASRNYVLFIGKASSTKNAAYIGYNHSGTDGSNTNFLTLGHYASDNLLNILGNGNVGIGTTSPDTLLHVHGSSPFVRISNSSADNHGIKITYGSSETHGLHLLYQPGSALSFIDNTYPTSSGQVFGDIYFRQNVAGTMTTRMTIKADGGGNVGIGTTNPATKLAVNGVSSFGLSSKLSMIGLDINSGETPTYVKIITTIPVASPSADFTVNIKGFIYGSQRTADISICWHYYLSTFYNPIAKSSGGWAPTIRLSAEGGFVAIVLSSPGYWPKFYVESMYSSAYNNQYVSGWSWVDADATGSPIVTVPYASNFGNGFVMLTDGNVGIGTTSPTTKLHVVGVISGSSFSGAGTDLTGTASGLSIGGNSSNITAYTINQSVGTDNSPTFVDVNTTGNIRLRNGDPTITFSDTDNTSSFIHVNSNTFYILCGPVSSSFGEWVVAANGRWPMEINLTNNNATFGGIVDAISFTGAGTGLTGTATGLSIGGTAATASYANALNTANNYTVNNLKVTSTVGIGTTLPQGILEVQGTTDASLAAIGSQTQLWVSDNRNQTTGVGGGISFAGEYINSNAAQITFGAIRGSKANDTSSNTIGNLELYAFGGDFKFHSQYGGLIGANTVLMTLSASGNLGIGTTTPAAKLHVVGSSVLSNNATINPDSYTGVVAGNIADGSGWGVTGIGLNGGAAGRSLGIGNSGSDFYFGASNGSSTASLQTYIQFNGPNRHVYLVPVSGNVGIGTTAPAAKFEMFGGEMAIKLSANTTSSFQWKNSSGTKIQEIRYDDSDGSMTLGGVGGYPIKFITSTTEKVRISGTGLVGIGTTSPTGLLDVYNGAGRYLNYSTTGLLKVQRNVATSDGATPVLHLINTQGMESSTGLGTGIQMDLGYGGFTTDTVGTAARGTRISAVNDTLYTSTASTQNASLVFYTSTAGTLTEKMRITSGGNVGIGTTAPSASLHVNSTTAGATLLRTDGTNGTLFSVVDDLSDSLMSVNNSAGLPVLEVFADDRIVAGQYGQNDLVVINNKVGIGTNNPVAKLDVRAGSGGEIIFGSYDANFVVKIQSGDQLNFYNGASANPGYINYAGGATVLSQNLHVEKATGGTTGLVRIKADGNLGIGTTLPAYKLHVNGGPTEVAGQVTAVFEKQSSTDGKIATFVNTTGSGYTSYIYIGSNPGRDWKIGKNVLNSGTTGHFQITNDLNQLRMQISAADDSITFPSSSVGIGTTSPTSPLTVQSNAKQLRLQTTSGPTSYFTDIGSRYDSSHPFTIEVANGAATATEYFGIYADGGGANNRIALLNGSVGIGTTVPTTPLHVVGVISGSSFSGAGTGLTGTATSLTAGTANSVAWTNVSGRPTVVSSFTNDSGYLTSVTNISGNAGSVTNGVYTTGSQSIAGNKTFTGTTIVTGSIETAAVRETFSAVSSTTTVSIDLSTATVFNLTFTSTISAFNITNVNTNRVNSFTLITAPNGTGATIAWSFQTNGGGAANVKWASNVSPTATTTNGRFDIFSFVYNGTNWYGFTGGQNYV